MPVILKNNASSTLATAITASDTAIVVADGSQFPALSAGEYFYATLVSPAGTTEIVKVTARVSNSLTVVRAQDGSSAASFQVGALVEMRTNAGSVQDAVEQTLTELEAAFATTIANQRTLRDVAALAADTILTYTAGTTNTVVAGEIIGTREEGYAYEVAASGATDHDAATAGGIKLYVLPTGAGVWDAQFFGIADDADRVQAAVNWVIAKAKSDQKSYKVFVVGQYTMDHPIGIFDFNGTSFTFCTVDIEAPTGGYLANRRTTFKFTNPLWPGIVIHQARNVTIKNVSIVGSANTLLLPSYSTMLERDTVSPPWWRRDGAGVDTGAADFDIGGRVFGLHAGVVWDLFIASQTAADKFSYYDGSTAGVPNHYVGGGGTTATQLDNCEVQGWIVGAQTSGSNIQLGDSFTFRECNFSYNRVHYMIGESQNRGIVAVDCHGKGCDVILAGGSGYGAGTGAGNYVRGGVYVFNYAMVDISSARGNGAFTDVYVESTWCVGHTDGNFGFTFKDCNIKLIDGIANSSAQVDTHLSGSGKVNFIGGFVGSYANDPRRMNMVNSPDISFTNVTFSDAPFYFQDNVPTFDNCKARNVTSQNFGGTHVGNFANFVARSTYALGDTFIDFQGDVWRAVSRSSGQSFGNTVVTVNGDGTATFTLSAANANNTLLNDHISVLTFTGVENNRARTPRNFILAGIGRVSNIAGTVITIEAVPLSLTSGTYSLYNQRFPRVLRPTVGDLTSGSATVTNVSNTNDWSVGDFIRTPNNAGWVAAGTRVLAKDTSLNTLTLSNPATATRTAEWLCDGEFILINGMQQGVPTSGNFHPGAYVRNSNTRTVDANNMVLDGWVCVTGGAPGTWQPVYLSTVSPAT
jgi:hypothetical protein